MYCHSDSFGGGVDMRARATFCGVSGMWSGMGWVRGRPRGLVGWFFVLLGMVFPLWYSRDFTTT